MQAKEEAARPATADEDSLANGESSWLKLIVIAKEFHHELSQVFQIAYLLSTAQHCSRWLLL
jgi:hypothetical protein